MRCPPIGAAGGVVAALLAAGCSAVVPNADPAGVAAEQFYTALGQGDAATACGLLSAGTRSKLEQSQGETCIRALPAQHLRVASVRTVEVYGQSAFVELDRDTAFLAQFPGGWRVVAAGCRSRPDQPYDCAVGG